MDAYKAAAIVFYRHEAIEGKVNTLVFMGLEGKEWRHFGGKIEEQDEKQSYKTMQRELMEETEGQLTFDRVFVSDKIYDQKSKMVVYFKLCDEELQERLKVLKPTKVKSEYKWMNPNDSGIPKYIRVQLNALKTKPKIAITVDTSSNTRPLDIFVTGLRYFYSGYVELCNMEDMNFLDKLVFALPPIGSDFKVGNEKIIPIIEKYLELDGTKNIGQFLDLFTINGFTARGWFDRASFQMQVDQLFQTE